jgi:hypothetical protein
VHKHASTSKAGWEIIQNYIVKMVANNGFMEPTKAHLVNLCDIGTILGLPCVLPMLESISVLMKFA